MSDTPILLRGKFYNTSRIYRCPNFHQCAACKKCTNYNQHQEMCRVCEKGQNYICQHTEKQKTTFIQIETKMKRPMFELDGRIDTETTTKQYVDEMELTQLEENLDKLSITAQNVTN